MGDIEVVQADLFTSCCQGNIAMIPFALLLRWQQAGPKQTTHAHLCLIILGEHKKNCAWIGHSQDSLCLLRIYSDNWYIFDVFFLQSFTDKNNMPNKIYASGILGVQGYVLKTWFVTEYVVFLFFKICFYLSF